MVIGTPNYMSPEQVRGEAIDQRSDIFAVGLVLYELLVYRQAFEAETQPAVLMKILSDQPAPLASLDPTIDPGIATVVYKALAKNPADRYQDLGSMKADLVRIVQRLETEPHDERTMVVPPPPPRGMQVVPGTPPGTTMSAADRLARHFAAIEAAIAAGDDAKARQELQLATQAAPGHPKLGEMGARITQARNARELARSIAEGRSRLAAGAITEAGQWLVRAQKVDPRAPEVAELRQEIERVADGREQDQDRRRRVAAALAHAREALKAGAFDTSMRAVTEALGLAPDDADALALKAEIEAARAAAPAGSSQPPPRTAGGRAVGPPPPASARQLSDAPPPVRPATGTRAATPPPAPPPITPGQTPAPVGAPVPERRSSKLPIAFLGLAAVAAIIFGLGAIFVWRQVSARFFAPRTAQQAPATPGTTPAEPGISTPPAPVEPATPPGEPQANATPGHAEPPAAPPTTPSGEDAAITSKLAQALADFQGQRTTEALNTLASLIDEAPQRDDLRVTADQWARAIEARAVELRDSARKRSGQLPPVMRQANQHLRQGETELAAGDPIAAARAFERGREAWAAIVNRQVARGLSDGPDEAPAPSSPPPREPAPAEPSRTAAREPAPREPEPSSRPAPPAAALTPEEEFERAQIMRLLQSFKRAFDSRSGDSLRPIWPSLTAGAAQSYQSQWQRSLTQQWTYNSVNIRMGGDGKRATVDCEVTVTSLSQGDRENSATRRRVRFDLQRLGPLWVIDGVGGM
jgi:tetratricopeptide (TPR) repeat protein